MLSPVIFPTAIFPIIILSWQSEPETNEPFSLPVNTRIIGLFAIPPEISIAEEKNSNLGAVAAISGSP